MAAALASLLIAARYHRADNPGSHKCLGIPNNIR